MPKRHWAFQDLTFSYEGYYIPDIYRQMWNIISDKGYYIHEYKYGHASFNQDKIKGAIAVWIATKEVEKKYMLAGLWVHLKFVWSLAPHPNFLGQENPPLVPKGKFMMRMHGFVNSDYLARWGASPILRALLPLRERYFYRRKIEAHKAQVRKDAEDIIKELQEFLSFLPRIK